MVVIDKPKYGTIEFYDEDGIERKVESIIIRPRNKRKVRGYVNISHGWSALIYSDVYNLMRVGEVLGKKGFVALMKDHSGHTPRDEIADSGEFAIKSDVLIEDASSKFLDELIKDYGTNTKAKFNWGHSYGAYIAVLSCKEKGLDYNAIAAIDPIMSFKDVLRGYGFNFDNNLVKKAFEWIEGKKIIEEIVYRGMATLTDVILMKNLKDLRYAFTKKIGGIIIHDVKSAFHETMNAPYLPDAIKGLNTPIYVVYCKKGSCVNGRKEIDEEKEKSLREIWEGIGTNIVLKVIGDKNGPDHAFSKDGICFNERHFEALMEDVAGFFKANQF
jgi:hypothetical protein